MLMITVALVVARKQMITIYYLGICVVINSVLNY